MANAFSQPGQFKNLKIQSTFDTQLVATVLGAKQARYDSNLQEIDNALAEYGNIDLARPEDKAYLKERLDELTSQVNGAGMQDLSSSAVTRNIEKHLDQALDEKVLAQAGITQQIRQFQSKVKQVQEKIPELYTEQNAAFAMDQAGLQDYYNGADAQGNKVDSLRGRLEYTPYSNLSDKYREILDKDLKVKEGITRKVPDPKNPGQYVETTVKGLDRIDIRNKVLLGLTPQDLKQAEIDAWAKYGDNAKEIYSNYVQPKIDEYQAEIDGLNLNREGKTEAEKAIADNNIEKRQKSIDDLTSNKKSLSEIHRFLGKEELGESLAAIYAPVNTSLKYSTDDGYYKELEMISKRAQSAIGYDDANKNTQPDVRSRKIETEHEDNYIPTQKAETEIESYKQGLDTLFNVAYNRLPEEEKNKFDTAYKQFIEDGELEDNASNKSSFMVQNSGGGKGNYYNVLEVAEAKDLNWRYKQKLEIQVGNYNEALDEKEAVNFTEIFRVLKDRGENENIKMFDEKGNVVSMTKYLSSVENIEDLTAIQKKTLLKSVYADITLSQTKDFDIKGGVNAKNTYNISRSAKLNGESGKSLPMLLNPRDIIYSAYSDEEFTYDFEKLKKDMQLPPQITKKQFKESIQPLMEKSIQSLQGNVPGVLQQSLNVMSKIPLVGGIISWGKEVGETVKTNMAREFGFRNPANNIIIGGEGTKTRKDLEDALQNKLYDDSWGTRDDSVEDDTDLRRVLDDRDSFRSIYEAKMAEDGANFAQNNEVIVEASTGRQGEYVPAFEELKDLGGVKFEDNQPVYVRDEGDHYFAYQTDVEVTKKDDEDSITKNSTRSASIDKTNFKQNSPLLKWLDQQSDRQRVTSDNTKELVSESAGFADAESQRSYIVGMGQLTGIKSEKELAKFTAEGAKNHLLDTHKKIFDGSVEGIKAEALINKIVDNGHLFRIKMQANDRGLYEMAIQYQAKEDGKVKWDNLKVIPTDTNDITGSVSLIDTAPQIFLLDYMDKLLTDIEFRGTKSVKGQLEKLSNIFPE